MSEERITVTDPVTAGINAGKWVGMKWGPVGVLVMVLIGAFSVAIWFLVAFMNDQTKERREDKVVIVQMTEKVTRTLADTAMSNDKLSDSIDKHSEAIEDLQKTMEGQRRAN